jgi:hypothetical protein
VNISSFNVTDVGYHYIGLRVLAAMPDASRDDQTTMISRNVAKYVRDKALRLMLPEPKSTYDTVGEKVCQELVHFEFAEATKRHGYELMPAGIDVLALLNKRKHVELRRNMAIIHLKTYSNLQAVVHTHITQNGIYSPVVEATKTINAEYIAALLRPTFGPTAESEAVQFLKNPKGRTPKQIEDSLREHVLRRLIPQYSMSVPLFRSMCDRLVSLRLLNAMKVSRNDVDFNRTYSPCVEGPPTRMWHHRVTIPLPMRDMYTVYLSEPNLEDKETQHSVLTSLDAAFSAMKEQAGYFDLPDVRDFVCENLSIPEAAFDEGVLALLEMPSAPITLGLTYDRISGRRKPLVRLRESTQLYNLIRRA